MKRIKTLCIVLLIVFFGNVYEGAILPFIDGVKYGMAIAKYQLEHREKTDEFVLLDVVSKNSSFLEESETNLKTGDRVLIRPNNVTVLVHSLPGKPVLWLVLQIVYFVFVLITLALGIWIPFLVVKIVRSLQNSQVFDREIIRKINRIGVILLITGVLGSLLQAMNVYSAETMVDLSNYNFTYAKVIDFNPIIMGVVILIMNEILKVGTEIKEEQDLTI
ncbi:MAG TPA: DUF2975 domain-containing protein [Paludibacter sp.]|nr:DUF2975 domain-containing protein [Paludibacter sp.]